MASVERLPSFQIGNTKDAKEILVFMAGFPDNQTSGWGTLIDKMKKRIEEKNDIQAIFMCMPDYEDNSSPKKWGYSFDEVLEIMDQTITYYVPDSKKKVNLIIHDWGSFVGLLYENKHPDRVKNVITLDVGIVRIPKQVKQIFLILLYQWWFAISYFISQLLGEKVGNILFFGYFSLVPQTFKPAFTCPRPIEDVKVHMTYPYYYFWKLYLFDRKHFPRTRFTTCPLFYMYGLQKPIMFHSDKFLKQLDETEGCKCLPVDCGHWIADEKPDIVYDEIITFLKL